MADAQMAHTWWDEAVPHVYLTEEQAEQAGLGGKACYRGVVMPGLTEGADPIAALLNALGQPTATVRASQFGLRLNNIVTIRSRG